MIWGQPRLNTETLPQNKTQKENKETISQTMFTNDLEVKLVISKTL